MVLVSSSGIKHYKTCYCYVPFLNVYVCSESQLNKFNDLKKNCIFITNAAIKQISFKQNRISSKYFSFQLCDANVLSKVKAVLFCDIGYHRDRWRFSRVKALVFWHSMTV